MADRKFLEIVMCTVLNGTLMTVCTRLQICNSPCCCTDFLTTLVQKASEYCSPRSCIWALLLGIEGILMLSWAVSAAMAIRFLTVGASSAVNLPPCASPPMGAPICVWLPTVAFSGWDDNVELGLLTGADLATTGSVTARWMRAGVWAAPGLELSMVRTMLDPIWIHCIKVDQWVTTNVHQTTSVSSAIELLKLG